MQFNEKSLLKRLQREKVDIVKGKDEWGWGAPITDTFRQWKAFIKGPPDSPYEGGVFQLAIDIVEKYPYEPPRVRFVTKVWHPNVSSVTGAICLDILKQEWSPALTLRTILVSIQAFLQDPIPDDPQDAVVAKQLLSEPEAFRKTAVEWTRTYAQETTFDAQQEESISTVMDMGFDRDVVVNALSNAGWDAQKAIDALL